MTLTKIGASLSGGADLVTITQSSHGFTVGKVLKSSGSNGTYATALANTAANAEVVGIVVQVIDATTFTMALSGRITVDGAVPNVTAGTVLFLSGSSAGDLTSTEPTTAGQVSKPVAVVTTADSEMLMVNYRGEIISSATESWDVNGSELILDVDGDTSLHANTDDQIDVQISGADDFRFTANTLNVLSGSTLSIDSGATLANSGTITGFNSTSYAVTQSSHGFAVGKVLKSSGSAGAYATAQADSAANAEVIGIVTVVADTNNFTLTIAGEIDVAAAVPDVAAGTVVFLSASAAGDLTATEPSTTGQISKPIGIVTTQNAKMLLLPYRGEVIGSNTAVIADDAVTNAKLANMAANTVKVRDANSSGDASDKAVADTQILIGDGTGFTAAALSGEATMTNAGVVSITDNIIDEANLKISNSPTNGQFLSAQSGNTGGLTWAAGGGGAVAHEGSQTTDAGTTSTSAVDLLSVSSLSIAATTHIWAAASVRQTANSGRVVGFGIKLNTTVISEAESSYNQSDLLWVGEQSVAISGAFLMHMGSRVANFLDGKTRMSSRAKSSTILDLGMSLRAENNMPTATITAVVTRAVCQATAIAAAADEMHVYTLAVS